MGEPLPLTRPARSAGLHQGRNVGGQRAPDRKRRALHQAEIGARAGPICHLRGTTWHYVAQDRPLHVVVGGCALSSEGVCILGSRPDLHRVQPWRPGSKRGKPGGRECAQEGNEAACRARAAARAAPPLR